MIILFQIFVHTGLAVPDYKGTDTEILSQLYSTIVIGCNFVALQLLVQLGHRTNENMGKILG